MRRWLGSLLAATLILRASTALAAPEDEAHEALNRGLAALERKDAEAALAEFETVKRLAPGANGPWFYAAEALHQLGRWREEVENLEAYLTRNPSVSDATEIKARIAALRAERFPARVRVIVEPADARISVDGKERGDDAWPIELAPGNHRFEAHATGREMTSKSVTVIGDTDTTVQLTLPFAPPAPPTSPTPEPTRTTSSRWQTLGLATGGVGAGMLITAVVIDAALLGPKVEVLRDAGRRFDPAAHELRSEAENLRTGAIVGYAVGGALLAGGLALMIFAPQTVKSPAGLAISSSGVRLAF